jgi:glycosyltransferase involved in cell wall biosynthesis
VTSQPPWVAVDMSGLQTEGIPRAHLTYTLEFLNALERILPPGHLMTVANWRRRLPGVDPIAISGRRLQRDSTAIDALLEMPELVYHVGRLDLATPTVPMRLISAGVPTSASVLGPPVPSDHLTRLRSRHEAVGAILRGFDLVLVSSDWVGSWLQQHCHLDSSHIVGVGVGVGCKGAAPSFDAQLTPAVFGDTQRYVIVAEASNDDGANSENLLRALAHLPAGTRVATKAVLLGRLSAVRRKELLFFAGDLGIAANQVVFAGQPDPSTAAVLVRAATLVVHLPSGDGTGLTALEAAASGTAVLVADDAALPTIFDWPPSRVDPMDAAALAGRIERVLTDSDFGDELRARGRQRAQAYSWEAVAEKAISAMSAVQARVRRRDGGVHLKRAFRLALVGTFETHSLAGDFNTRLAQVLSREASIDTFGRSTAPVADGDSARRWPLTALGRAVDVADFDALLYVLSDDDEHAAILRAHLTAPGAVLLLTDSLLHTHVAMRRRFGSASTVSDGSEPSAWLFHDDSLRMLGEAVRAAEHVFVLDPWTAEVAKADAALTGELELTVVGVPSPEVGGGADEPGQRNGVFVTGPIDRVTDVAPVLAAIAQVPALRSAEVRITPITGGDPDVCLAVSRTAGQLGLRRVHTLAQLGLPELRLALRHVRALVYLSGKRTEPLVLSEAYAAGTPVVRIGSATPEASTIASLVDLLTDDEHWGSAHRTALEQASSTKMEEIADAFLSTLRRRR